MKTLCENVLQILKGRTLVTAESLTGGGIGQMLTSVSGSSEVYKGGVISYRNEVKHQVLGVSQDTLMQHGAVSAQSAAQMVAGVRKLLNADVAVSVTGLAGPGGDDFGHSVGTVFIGYESEREATVRQYQFDGDRDSVRYQTIRAALLLILEME